MPMKWSKSRIAGTADEMWASSAAAQALVKTSDHAGSGQMPVGLFQAGWEAADPPGGRRCQPGGRGVGEEWKRVGVGVGRPVPHIPPECAGDGSGPRRHPRGEDVEAQRVVGTLPFSPSLFLSLILSLSLSQYPSLALALSLSHSSRSHILSHIQILSLLFLSNYHHPSPLLVSSLFPL